MLKRFERPLRIVCMVLGALALFQIGRIAFRNNPSDKLEIPPLPTLATSVQSNAGSSNSVPAKGMESTNSKALVQGEKKSTNAIAASADKTTNVVTEKTSATNETNVVSSTDTKSTNTLTAGGTTNVIAQTNGETNKTNSVVLKEGEKKPTNSASLAKSPPRGMPSFPGAPGGKKIDLPPAIQARVDKITQSEILASVVRPLPMALLGIAGDSAFLRSATGQSGVVKEGDELGGLKLLKIGINRVLVEEDGEKKELMVFSGFGGESLLPKEKEQKETPK